MDGEWEFYFGKFDKEDLETTNAIPLDSCSKESCIFESVLGVWDEHVKDSPNPEKGYGTYHLKILSNTEQAISLKINTINSVRDVYVNGRLISSRIVVQNSLEAFFVDLACLCILGEKNLTL